MASIYRQQLEEWLARLDVKADRVLDIGGAQNPVRGRTRSWEVNSYKIADLPTPHQGGAPDYEIDLNSSAIFPLGIADLIFCLETFEYVWNPAHAFYLLRQMMVDQAWVSFPFIYPVHNPVEDDALRYTEQGIRLLAISVGLKIEEIIYRQSESTKLLQYFSEDRFKAAQGIDHSVIGYIVRFSRG